MRGVIQLKIITYNDIHLPIDPMYHNVAVLFINEYPLHCGKYISVINKKLFDLKCLCAIFLVVMKTFL